MKTKKYEFTEIEVIALRNATHELFHATKHLKPQSEIAIKLQNAIVGLKEQFAQDVMLWK